MRAYIITTGTVFGLLVLAHVARIFAEEMRVANPAFIVTTATGRGHPSFQ